MVFKKKNLEKYLNKIIRLFCIFVMVFLYQWRFEGCFVVLGFGEEEGGGIKGGLDFNQVIIFCNNRFFKGGNFNKYCIMFKVV